MGELFEHGDRALDLLRVDAVGHAEVSGHAEAVGRHKNQVVFLGLHAERHGVVLQRLGEDVERAAGAYHVEADAGQRIVEQVHVRLVDVEIGGLVDDLGHAQLNRARRAVVAGAARDLAHHGHEQVGVGGCGIHRDIADAFARQAQRLRPRVAGQRVRVEAGRVGLGGAVEHDFAVRFVADQEDIVAVFDLLGGQDRGQTLERVR